jgi:RNA polymerase sigma-70 factor (ECF subfamily)
MMSESDHTPNPDPNPDPEAATLLLRRVQAGDAVAAEDLLPLVYAQLRATAGRYFQAQPRNHTLQPTALVHEAYMKMVQTPDPSWSGRVHFCAVAATAMRQILHDHARGKAALKRRGDGHAVPLTAVEAPSASEAVDLIALDEALTRLGEVDERGARIVELRFFGGLTNEQIAEVIDVSRPTVERTWRRCRAWIAARLEGGGSEAAGPAA